MAFRPHYCIVSVGDAISEAVRGFQKVSSLAINKTAHSLHTLFGATERCL